MLVIYERIYLRYNLLLLLLIVLLYAIDCYVNVVVVPIHCGVVVVITLLF